MRINFEEISIFGEKSGICTQCGKKASRKRKFWQTINPFNKNKDGSQKSKEDILKECINARDNWLREPVFHVKCK